MGYNNFKKNYRVRSYINRFKTIRDKIIKVKSSITFLIRCRNSGIIPKFITRSTKNVSSLFGIRRIPGIEQNIKKCIQDLHNKILRLAIKEKHELLKHFQSELIVIEQNLRQYLIVQEMEEFLRYEDRIAASLNEKVKRVHIKKFNCLKDLQRKELGIKLNEKWFINKTDKNIPSEVQWTLSLGHKHALPIRREEFPILNIVTEGEDFIQTIQNKEEQEIARTKLTTIIDNHLNKMKLTNRDKFLLDTVKETDKFLRGNKDILILKADKGNTTVALTKQDYDIRMENILGDVTKYKLINKDPTNKLQKANNNIVEELFRQEIITNAERNILKTNIATAPRLYGLPKIHKEEYPLRPICSFNNSPSYQLCKYVANILKKITERSKYNVKDSLEFKNRVRDQYIEDDEKLISLDVVSLFPSIPVDLALDIIEEKWNMIGKYTKIEKDLFLRIIKFCIEENRYFQYNGKVYLQQKGLPMGSPASPIVADIVMDKLLDTCIEKLSIGPKIMIKYVDDLFCIVSECAINEMLDTFNQFNPNIKFTMEEEVDSKLPYLDTLLIRRGNSIVMDWYQKPTASGRIINYYSKHSKQIIMNTAKNFIERVLAISDKDFHVGNKERIKEILIDNNFPIQIVQRLLNQFRKKQSYNINKNSNNNNNNNTNETSRSNITERKVYKSMTYVPQISERLKKSRIFDAERYGIAYRTYNTLGRLFSKTKDRINKLDMSNVVYKIPCNGNDNESCNKVYIGTTKNKLRTRIAGHKSDQKYRDNIDSQKTALATHCSKSNHYPNFENVSVLNIEHNYKRRYMLEMLQIINIPGTQRINFKADTDNVAQNYRHLIHKK